MSAPMFPARPCRVVIRCVAILAIVIFPGRRSCSQVDADDWNWMREHFQPAFTDLMPIKQDLGMYIGYRSHQDLHTDVLEYSFVIEYDPKETDARLTLVSARVREADSVSIYGQMLKMHGNDPREDAASIQKKVKLKTWNLTEAACPALGAQFAKFQQLSIRTPSFEVLYIHPLVHEFHIAATGGDMDMQLFDNQAQLIKWALGTRQILERCAAVPLSGPSSGKP